jgi:hypothetical protein
VTNRHSLLVRLAGRNLLASPINLLIGGLLFSGTIVFVVVGGLLDSVNQSMARSVSSIGGHVQIDSAKSRDELAPFGQLGGDLEKAVRDLLDARALAPENVAAFRRVSSKDFWDGFEDDPSGSLEFLENQGAPQVTNASLVFLRYLGTNLDAFPQSFIADLVYEEQLKLESAGRLDKTKDALALGRMIATDDELERYVKENRTPTRESILQLDALLQLYRVRLNDTLTIKAFTKSGSMRNVNVPVYGTFAFTGLEKSPLAGNTSLMDIMSFRDLYGHLPSDQEAEIAEVQQATGAKVIPREDAECELFGEDAGDVVAEATPRRIDVDQQLTGTGRKLLQEDLMRRVYPQDEIASVVVLDAAVLLRDPRSLDATVDEINRLAETEHLGIPAVSWQKASGLLGQVIRRVPRAALRGRGAHLLHRDGRHQQRDDDGDDPAHADARHHAGNRRATLAGAGRVRGVGARVRRPRHARRRADRVEVASRARRHHVLLLLGLAANTDGAPGAAGRRAGAGAVRHHRLHAFARAAGDADLSAASDAGR